MLVTISLKRQNLILGLKAGMQQQSGEGGSMGKALKLAKDWCT